MWARLHPNPDKTLCGWENTEDSAQNSVKQAEISVCSARSEESPQCSEGEACETPAQPSKLTPWEWPNTLVRRDFHLSWTSRKTISTEHFSKTTSKREQSANTNFFWVCSGRLPRAMWGKRDEAAPFPHSTEGIWGNHKLLFSSPRGSAALISTSHLVSSYNPRGLLPPCSYRRWRWCRKGSGTARRRCSASRAVCAGAAPSTGSAGPSPADRCSPWTWHGRKGKLPLGKAPRNCRGAAGPLCNSGFTLEGS